MDYFLIVLKGMAAATLMNLIGFSIINIEWWLGIVCIGLLLSKVEK